MAATRRAAGTPFPTQTDLYPPPAAHHKTGPSSMPEIVREYVADYPLDIDRILRAIVEVHGLARVLEAIGELFGDAGRTPVP